MNKILKYTLFFVSIVLSLIVIPRNEINKKDLVTVVSLILSSFVLLDLYFPLIDNSKRLIYKKDDLNVT